MSLLQGFFLLMLYSTSIAQPTFDHGVFDVQTISIPDLTTDSATTLTITGPATTQTRVVPIWHCTASCSNNNYGILVIPPSVLGVPGDIYPPPGYLPLRVGGDGVPTPLGSTTLASMPGETVSYLSAVSTTSRVASTTSVGLQSSRSNTGFSSGVRLDSSGFYTGTFTGSISKATGAQSVFPGSSGLLPDSQIETSQFMGVSFLRGPFTGSFTATNSSTSGTFSTTPGSSGQSLGSQITGSQSTGVSSLSGTRTGSLAVANLQITGSFITTQGLSNTGFWTKTNSQNSASVSTTSGISGQLSGSRIWTQLQQTPSNISSGMAATSNAITTVISTYKSLSSTTRSDFSNTDSSPPSSASTLVLSQPSISFPTTSPSAPSSISAQATITPTSLSSLPPDMGFTMTGVSGPIALGFPGVTVPGVSRGSPSVFPEITPSASHSTTLDPAGAIASSSASKLQVAIIYAQRNIQNWIDHPSDTNALNKAKQDIETAKDFGLHFLGDLGGGGKGGGGCSSGGGLLGDLIGAASCAVNSLQHLGGDIKGGEDDIDKVKGDLSDLGGLIKPIQPKVPVPNPPAKEPSDEPNDKNENDNNKQSTEGNQEKSTQSEKSTTLSTASTQQSSSTSTATCSLTLTSFSLTPGTDLTMLTMDTNTGTSSGTASVTSSTGSSPTCGMTSSAYTLMPGTDLTTLTMGTDTGTMTGISNTNTASPASTVSSASTGSSTCSKTASAFTLTPGTDLTSLTEGTDTGTATSSGTYTTAIPPSTLQTSTIPSTTGDPGPARPLCFHNPVDQDPPNCIEPPTPAPPAVVSCTLKAAPTNEIWQYSPNHYCACNTNTSSIYPTIPSVTATGDALCAYSKTLPSNIYLSQIVTTAPVVTQTCTPNWDAKECDCNIGPTEPLIPGSKCGGITVPDLECFVPWVNALDGKNNPIDAVFEGCSCRLGGKLDWRVHILQANDGDCTPWIARRDPSCVIGPDKNDKGTYDCDCRTWSDAYAPTVLSNNTDLYNPCWQPPGKPKNIGKPDKIGNAP